MGISPLPSDATLESMIEAAIADWEDATGWHPFLSDGVPTTEVFSPCGSIVDFHGGIIGDPTSFRVGGYYDENSAFQGGQSLVRQRDYTMRRPKPSWPYTYAKLEGYWYDEDIPNSVQITAVFGFSTTVPANAWEAVMADVLGGLVIHQQAATGIVIEKRSGDQSEKYADPTKASTNISGLSESARDTAALYKRMEIA